MERPPSVDALTRVLAAQPEFADVARTAIVDAVRAAIAGHAENPTKSAAGLLRDARRTRYTSVINATGVLLHTNLGRAPLAPQRLRYDDNDPDGDGLDNRTGRPSRRPMRASNLEFDLATGERGSRQTPVAGLLTSLTGCEAALVVNNCAAAVMLTLAALAVGRPVLVSRGELVEIGGGFRIPDVLAQSGATLVEVGTTNRTRLADYSTAASGEVAPAIILKVHQSNYRITGFTEEVDVAGLTTLGIPVVADIGSGLLDATTPWLADPQGRVPRLGWLTGEPAARQTLAAGADLVTFSGDKLLGGPQAGIIAGRRDLVARCAAHPLARALRPGGQVMGALQETLLAYSRNRAADIPFWDMATRTVATLSARAAAVAGEVGDPRATVAEMKAVPGGGTLPNRTIASAGLRIEGDFADALRAYDPPIVARRKAGLTHLDLRTVAPDDDGVLAAAIRGALRR